MSTYFLIWSPEGRAIAKVEARDAVAAKRLAPIPYRKFKGEILVVEDVCTCKNNEDYCDRCLAAGVRR